MGGGTGGGAAADGAPRGRSVGPSVRPSVPPLRGALRCGAVTFEALRPPRPREPRPRRGVGPAGRRSAHTAVHLYLYPSSPRSVPASVRPSLSPSISAFIHPCLSLSFCPSLPLFLAGSISTSVCPSLPQSICPCVHPSLGWSVPTCPHSYPGPSVPFFIPASVHPCLHPSLSRSIRPYPRLSVSPWVRPSLCLSLYLSVPTSIHPCLGPSILASLCSCLSPFLSVHPCPCPSVPAGVDAVQPRLERFLSQRSARAGGGAQRCAALRVEHHRGPLSAAGGHAQPRQRSVHRLGPSAVPRAHRRRVDRSARQCGVCSCCRLHQGTAAGGAAEPRVCGVCGAVVVPPLCLNDPRSSKANCSHAAMRSWGRRSPYTEMPQPEHGVQKWSSQCRGDVELLEGHRNEGWDGPPLPSRAAGELRLCCPESRELWRAESGMEGWQRGGLCSRVRGRGGGFQQKEGGFGCVEGRALSSAAGRPWQRLYGCTRAVVLHPSRAEVGDGAVGVPAHRWGKQTASGGPSQQYFPGCGVKR